MQTTHCSGRTTRTPFALNGWARDGAVRAEHATITCKRFKHLTAGTAFVEPLTGVGGHRFRFCVAADRTGDR